MMRAVVEAQRAQVVGAQIRQLNALNAQLSQQMAEQQRQAVLAQILFETEQMARRVRATAKSDLFSACLHAEAWIPSVAAIRPEHFLSVDAKRSWSAAIETMTAAAGRARRDPKVSSELQTYERAMAERGRMSALPEAPGVSDAEIARLAKVHQDAIAAAAPNPKRFWMMMSMSAVPPVLCVVAIVIGLIISVVEAGAKTGTQSGAVMATICIIALVPAIIAGVAIAIFVFVRRNSKRNAVPAASAAVANASRLQEERRSRDAALASFAADPSGGSFLDGVQRDHPLLTQTPPPEAYEDAAPSSIVERQTVVTRCQFCGNLTPVDLQGCQHCGAKLR